MGVVVNFCRSSLLEREDIEKLGVFRISSKRFNESLSQDRPVRRPDIASLVVDLLGEGFETHHRPQPCDVARVHQARPKNHQSGGHGHCYVDVPV